MRAWQTLLLSVGAVVVLAANGIFRFLVTSLAGAPPP
jgi:hypothetical protein